MHLSSPNFTFTVPSVYDGTQLDCRIFLPSEIQQPDSAPRWQKRGAIVAHPYAPLGGCYDDPVVRFVGGELLRSGYIVGTFNFRGAGDSEGRTSWTARPELADYVSFYGFMLHYLRFLGVEGVSKSKEDDSEEIAEKVHLILGGYSYGSLIASHLPAVDVLVDLFENTSKDSALSPIRQIAKTVSAWTDEKLQTQVRPLSINNSSSEEQNDGAKKTIQETTTTSYLLVSPLLPPISLFLTLFSKFSLDAGMEISAQGKQVPCPKPVNQLRTHRTLVIYGNEDTFTSAGKLRKWSDEITRTPGSRFESHGIDGAGHFWHEDGAESQARNALRDWLGRT